MGRLTAAQEKEVVFAPRFVTNGELAAQFGVHRSTIAALRGVPIDPSSPTPDSYEVAAIKARMRHDAALLNGYGLYAAWHFCYELADELVREEARRR